MTYWVIRRGTGRGSGDYYWFNLGEPHDTARPAWSNLRSDADHFESWEEAQAECCNMGDTCRPVKVVSRG